MAAAVNQAPKRADTSVSQWDFGAGEHRMIPQRRQPALRHRPCDDSRRADHATPAAGLHQIAADSRAGLIRR